METATQTLHRLTSYTPGRRWDQPADDPRVVQDLQTNDMDRFPWFFKRYPQGLPRQALPRDLPATAEPDRPYWESWTVALEALVPALPPAPVA